MANAAPLVENVIKLMRIEQHYPQCRLAIIIAPKSQLYSQATLLEQVLTNLLNNSLQAGSQQITLRLETDGDRQTLILEDDGGGLSAEQLAQPFVPFAALNRKDFGLGW